MNLKTYRAPSMAQALAEVKRDLGKDAVILHTRSYKVGGILGFGAKNVIEVTAADQATTRASNAKPQQQVQRAVRPAATPPALAPTFPPTDPKPRAIRPAAPRTPQQPLQSPPPSRQPEPTPDPAPEDLIFDEPTITSRAAAADRQDAFIPASFGTPQKSRSPQPPIPELKPTASSIYTTTPTPRPSPGPAAPSNNTRSLSTPAPIAPVDSTAVRALQDDLDSIKRMMGQVLLAQSISGSGNGSGGASNTAPRTNIFDSEPLLTTHARLHEAGVSAPIIDRVLNAIRDDLRSDERADAAIVQAAAIRHLATLIPTTGTVTRASRRDGRPLTLAFVGPTGVGKTTTIAKVAAAYKLRQDKRVGLITSDTYRIAAVDQLRTYANIIGLPLKVAMTPDELGEACSSLSDCDVILVDTAGRSQNDAHRLQELRAFLNACNPDETHLVLSASVAPAVLDRAVDKFAVLSPNRVIFSKLDEAITPGVVPAVLARAAAATGRTVKASFVTTGQEVPDHIELANPDRIARQILGIAPMPSTSQPESQPDTPHENPHSIP